MAGAGIGSVYGIGCYLARAQCDPGNHDQPLPQNGSGSVFLNLSLGEGWGEGLTRSFDLFPPGFSPSNKTNQ
jgi:hypothetical protein